MDETDLIAINSILEDIRDNTNHMESRIEEVSQYQNTVTRNQQTISSILGTIAGQLIIISAAVTWVSAINFVSLGSYEWIVNWVCGLWAVFGLTTTFGSFFTN